MGNLRDELISEYQILQGQYESFDDRALMIKSWSAPLLAAGLGLGADGSKILIVAAMTAALFLWMMEAIWKGFQYCNTDRIKAIEAFFRGEESEDFKPFQIFTSWGEVYDRHFRKPSSLIPILLQPFVFLPYLPTIFLGAIILAVT